MPIVRVEHNRENPYVVMNKTGLEDPRLSFKAKGLLAFLLSKPDDWQVYVHHLAKQSTDGVSAIRSALKEMIDHGYAKFDRVRDEQGQYSEGTYTVFEVPHSGFPNVDNPNEENRTLLSTDSELCTDLTNNSASATPSRASEPKPEKPKKTQPEAVKVFRSKAHRFPSKCWWEEVDTVVGNDPACLERWGDVVFNWLGLGWNPTNVKGMLDCYKQNVTPGDYTNNSRQKGRTSPLDRSIAAVQRVLAECQEEQYGNA